MARHTRGTARELFRVIFFPVTILFMGAIFLFIVEEEQDLMFHDWLYFMLVTATIVGFGDLYPISFWGQLIVIFSIMFIITTVPTALAAYSRAKNLRSVYSSLKFDKGGDTTDHITLLGSTNLDALRTFLQELYHQDHGYTDIQTVILNKSPPSEEVQLFIKNSKECR